jgi:gamma-glutamylcyclotransferase (GGCT)/AIG2-like uncharacterized protein YtfP
MTALRETVFVYGTLRSGGSQHFRMAGAEFVAEGTARGRLYRIDWYPGLVLGGTGDGIVGEVYQVSPGMLDDLDRFEGAEYRRVRAPVALSNQRRISAWVWEWLGAADENRRITSGNWLSEPRD